MKIHQSENGYSTMYMTIDEAKTIKKNMERLLHSYESAPGHRHSNFILDKIDLLAVIVADKQE